MTDTACVGICILENDVCIGCGRTSEEIASGGIEAMQAEEQQARDLRRAEPDDR